MINILKLQYEYEVCSIDWGETNTDDAEKWYHDIYDDIKNVLKHTIDETKITEIQSDIYYVIHDWNDDGTESFIVETNKDYEYMYKLWCDKYSRQELNIVAICTYIIKFTNNTIDDVKNVKNNIRNKMNEYQVFEELSIEELCE